MIFFKKNDYRKKTPKVVDFARFFFLFLIFFELLNYLKILKLNTQFTWLGLVITSVFILILLEITAYRYYKLKGHYLHYSIWIITAIALWLDAAGDFFHLYGTINWWDQAVHYGVSAIAAFSLFAVINAFWIDKFKYSLLLKEGKFKLALFLAATSTISLGALYEIEEYLEDIFFHTNRLGPGTDTANDLLMNSAGVLTTVIILTAHYLVTHNRKILD